MARHLSHHVVPGILQEISLWANLGFLTDGAWGSSKRVPASKAGSASLYVFTLEVTYHHFYHTLLGKIVKNPTQLQEHKPHLLIGVFKNLQM